MIILSKILNRYLALFIKANVQVECGGGSADAECVQPSRWRYSNKSPCEYTFEGVKPTIVTAQLHI